MDVDPNSASNPILIPQVQPESNPDPQPALSSTEPVAATQPQPQPSTSTSTSIPTEPISIVPPKRKIQVISQPAISTSIHASQSQLQLQPPSNSIPHLISPILTILSESGFNSSTSSSTALLSRQLDSFLTSIATLAANLTQASGRNKVNHRDLLAAFVAGEVVRGKYPTDETEEGVELMDEEYLLEEMKDLVHKAKIRDYLLSSEPNSIGYRNRFPNPLEPQQQDEDNGENSRFHKEKFLPSDDEDEISETSSNEDEGNDQELEGEGEGLEFKQLFKTSKDPSSSSLDPDEYKVKKKENRLKRKKYEQRIRIGVGLQGEINRKKRRVKKKDGDGDVEMNSYDQGKGKGKQVDQEGDWEELVEIGGLLSHLPDLPPKHTWVRTEAYAPRIASSSTTISLSHLDLKLESSRLTSISLRGLIRGMEVAESNSRNFKLIQSNNDLAKEVGVDDHEQKKEKELGEVNKSNEESSKIQEIGGEVSAVTSSGGVSSNNVDNNGLDSNQSNQNQANSTSSKPTQPAQSMETFLSMNNNPIENNTSSTSNSTENNTPSTSIPPSTSTPITNKPKTLLRLRMPSSKDVSNNTNTSSPSGSSTPIHQQVPLTSVPRNLLPETNSSSALRRFSVGNNSSPIPFQIPMTMASGSGSGFSTPIRRSTFGNLNFPGSNINTNNNLNGTGSLDSPMTPWGNGSGSGMFGSSSIPQTPSFNYPNTPLGIGGMNFNDLGNGSGINRRDSELNLNGNGNGNGLNEGNVNGNVESGLNLNLPGSVNFKKDWYSVEGIDGKGKTKGKKKKSGNKRKWII